MKQLRDLFAKKLSPAEMLTKLKIQQSKLEQFANRIENRMKEGKEEAKKALEKGDEGSYRVASRKYILAKNTMNSISTLNEMAQGMIDLIDMGEVLKEVISTGEDLSAVQKQLGLDTSKLESSLAKIREGMTRMESASNVLTATIENTLAGSAELSAEQDALRKELLSEISAEKAEEEKLKEEIAKEKLR